MNKILSIRAALLVSLLIFLAGCGTPKARQYSVNIIPNTQVSMEVDLVGATKLEISDWRSYPLNKYWQPGDKMRAGADKFTAVLVGGKATPNVLNITDETWARWKAKKAQYLVVVANLPGQETGRMGYKEIDLSTKFSTETLEIEIQDARIVVKTPQK
jgi:hypothetical protein